MVAFASEPMRQEFRQCRQLVALNDFLQVWYAVFKTQRCSDNELIYYIDRCVYAWLHSANAQEQVLAHWCAVHGALRLQKPQKALRHARRCLHVCKNNSLGSILWELTTEALWHAYQALNKTDRSAYWQREHQKLTI